MLRRHVLILVGLVTASCLAAACGPDEVARNLPPIIDEVRSSSETVSPGSTTTLAVTAHDATATSGQAQVMDVGGSGGGSDTGGDSGGGGSLTGSIGALTATWTVANDAWSIQGEGATASLTAPDTYESSTRITVEVSDAEGATASATLTVGTGQNMLPTVGSITGTPNPVAPAGTISLQAKAADGNDDPLSYAWSAPDGWSLSSTSGESVELTAPDESGRQATVELTVSDGYGGEASSTLQVATEPNSSPSISSMTATPPQPSPGVKATVRVRANDPDGDDLTYDWQATSGWTLSGEGNEVEVTAPNQYSVTGTISVTVSDPRGAETSGEVVLSTAANDGPVISSLTASPPSVAKGGTIDLDVSADDPNADPLSYSWSVGSSDWSLTPSMSSAQLTAPDKPGETTTVEVVVSDGSGKSSRASIVVSTRPNQIPSVDALTANPSQMDPGATSQLQATASDADGDMLTYSWSAPSGWNVSGSGSSATVTAPSQYGASAVVQLTVSDGFGGSATGSVVVSTSRNQPPVIGSVTPNPQVVAPGGTATVDAQATDPNGDSLSYSWSVPSGWSKSGSGDSITVTAPNSYDAQATVKVTVDDGNGGTSRSATIVRTKANTPPVVLSMSATKTTLDPEGTTDIDVQATDPNGQQLSYNWKLPAGWSGMSTSDSITVTAPDKYSEQVQVTVEISDGQDTTTDSIALETVANQPPVVRSVQANPNPVIQNGTTDVVATADDPLGDALTYSWMVDNANWTLTGSGANVKLTAPDTGGSSTKVTVTVDDGHGATDQMSLTVDSSSCASGRANCDGQISNGCEVNLNSDENNCGQCGNTCSAPNPYCGGGSCTQLFTFSGVKQNVNMSQLGGWNVCHTETYAANSANISNVLSNKCTGSQLMMACRQTGSSTLRVAAHAPRGDVTTDTGTGDTTHRANGVEWYFSNSYSWGFAPAGEPVSRNSCDTQSTGNNDRICWHTGGGSIQDGWRCGDRTNLNGNSSWERLLLHAN